MPSLTLSLGLDPDSPRKGDPRRGPSNKSNFKDLFGTESLGELAGYGQRADRWGPNKSGRPEATWVGLTLHPRATAVLAGRELGHLPARLPSRGPEMEPGSQALER